MFTHMEDIAGERGERGERDAHRRNVGLEQQLMPHLISFSLSVELLAYFKNVSPSGF